jgi:hypothetical protein
MFKLLFLARLKVMEVKMILRMKEVKFLSVH